MNPTWSFKDRHAAVNISMARHLGHTKVVASSTGNAGQAVAAYAALAGLRALIIGYPTSSELLRRVMQIHGANVVTMPKKGNRRDDAATRGGPRLAAGGLFRPEPARQSLTASPAIRLSATKSRVPSERRRMPYSCQPAAGTASMESGAV